MKIPYWGCPGLNFKANLPFNGMRAAYAAFEKEIPMALQSTIGFFKKLKCYVIFISIMIPLFLFYEDNASDGKDPYA
jgi:hypothetical protein